MQGEDLGVRANCPCMYLAEHVWNAISGLNNSRFAVACGVALTHIVKPIVIKLWQQHSRLLRPQVAKEPIGNSHNYRRSRSVLMKVLHFGSRKGGNLIQCLTLILSLLLSSLENQTTPTMFILSTSQSLSLLFYFQYLRGRISMMARE